MRIPTSFCLIVLLLLCAGCNQASSEKLSSIRPMSETTHETSIPSSKTPNMLEIKDILSKLVKMTLWKADIVAVDEHDSFTQLSLRDPSHGWLMGNRALYKTADRGNTWERVQVALPDRARLSDVFFLNRSLGWVLAHECEPNQSCNEDHSWLMHTTDGGSSWQLQYESQSSVGYRIHFVDEQNGWLIGIKYKSSLTSASPFVLRTSDQGNHWTDVSDGINLILQKDTDAMRDPTHDGAVQMIASSPLSILVATRRMRIFRTDDGGHTWAQIAYFSDEPDQTGIRRFDINDNQFFLVGGTLSQEGTWGILLRQQNNNSWLRYRLPEVAFMDVLFLQGNRILASGSVLSETESPNKRWRTDGVVLYSSDGAKTWAVVYRNAGTTSINMLSATESGNVWAVGDNGLVMRLELPQ